MAGIVPSARLAGAAAILTLAHVGAGVLVGGDRGTVEVDCSEERANLLGEGAVREKEEEDDGCETNGKAGMVGCHLREAKRRKGGPHKNQTPQEMLELIEQSADRTGGQRNLQRRRERKMEKREAQELSEIAG